MAKQLAGEEDVLHGLVWYGTLNCPQARERGVENCTSFSVFSWLLISKEDKRDGLRTGAGHGNIYTTDTG
jgi:hypothetical protein